MARKIQPTVETIRRLLEEQPVQSRPYSFRSVVSELERNDLFDVAPFIETHPDTADLIWHTDDLGGLFALHPTDKTRETKNSARIALTQILNITGHPEVDVKVSALNKGWARRTFPLLVDPEGRLLPNWQIVKLLHFRKTWKHIPGDLWWKRLQFDEKQPTVNVKKEMLVGYSSVKVKTEPADSSISSASSSSSPHPSHDPIRTETQSVLEPSHVPIDNETVIKYNYPAAPSRRRALDAGWRYTQTLGPKRFRVAELDTFLDQYLASQVKEEQTPDTQKIVGHSTAKRQRVTASATSAGGGEEVGPERVSSDDPLLQTPVKMEPSSFPMSYLVDAP
ncbi:hypothetical protein HDV00_004174 [Rhizophlyctis rosea]|nr:hypothetical protein HDV00_004174 [Rhizophlyctis rosea]